MMTLPVPRGVDILETVPSILGPSWNEACLAQTEVDCFS